MSDNAADVILAEFESLREEFFARLESQRQSFHYLAVIAAAVIALVGAKVDINPAVLLLALPLVTAPLGFIFFDNELVIWGIAGYIHDTLRPELSRLVQHEVLRYEGRFPDSHGSSLHLVLSTGRWLLFLVPTLLPIGYAVLKHRLEWFTTLPYWPFMIVDVVLLMVLVWAIWIAVSCRNRVWRVEGDKRSGLPDRRGVIHSLRGAISGSS